MTRVALRLALPASCAGAPLGRGQAPAVRGPLLGRGLEPAVRAPHQARARVPGRRHRVSRGASSPPPTRCLATPCRVCQGLREPNIPTPACSGRLRPTVRAGFYWRHIPCVLSPRAVTNASAACPLCGVPTWHADVASAANRGWRPLILMLIVCSAPCTANSWPSATSLTPGVYGLSVIPRRASLLPPPFVTEWYIGLFLMTSARTMSAVLSSIRIPVPKAVAHIALCCVIKAGYGVTATDCVWISAAIFRPSIILLCVSYCFGAYAMNARGVWYGFWCSPGKQSTVQNWPCRLLSCNATR